MPKNEKVKERGGESVRGRRDKGARG